jgi:hypothetical protein
LLGKRKRDGEGGFPPPIKALMAEITKAPPSALANHKQFKLITGPDNVVGCNRPFETDTIPLELLDQAFAIFKTKCRAEPSTGTLAGLMELAHVGCKWHDSENQRRDETIKVLRKATGLFFHAEKISKTEFTTDGNLPVFIIPPAIRECKNEHGEALNKAISYYGRFLIDAIKDCLCYYNYDTRFPSILIVDMGTSSHSSVDSAYGLCRSVLGILRCSMGWEPCKGRTSHACFQLVRSLEGRRK